VNDSILPGYPEAERQRQLGGAVLHVGAGRGLIDEDEKADRPFNCQCLKLDSRIELQKTFW
jgi:hypothetical protein